MRENSAERARRWIRQAAVAIVRVEEGYVLGAVRDPAGVRTVKLVSGFWSCTCEARGPCSHVRAIQLLVVPRQWAQPELLSLIGASP